MNRPGRVPVWLQTGVVILSLLSIILGGDLHDWLVDRLGSPNDFQFRGSFALAFALVPIGLMMHFSGWLKEIQQERLPGVSSRAIVLSGALIVLTVFAVELFHGRRRTGMALGAAFVYVRYWWWKNREKDVTTSAVDSR